MTELLQELLGFALIGALFAAYFVQRRRRGKPAAAVAPSPPPPIPAPAAEPGPAAEVSLGSPNWAVPAVFVALLAGAATHRGSGWGTLWTAIFWLIVLAAAYSAFAPSQVAAELARRPGMTRSLHYVRIGVPYVLFPAIAYVVVMPLHWLPGLAIAALPWLALLLLPFVKAPVGT